jgi:peptidoglycan/LPS O-acetylase OafA/YrhL
MAFWIGNYALIAGTDTLVAFSHAVRFPVINLLNPLWSVCVEEQFYVAWPLILKKALSGRQLLFAVGFLIVASIISRLCFENAGQHNLHIAQTYYFCTISRIDPLMAGALVAVIQLNFSNAWRKICQFATPIAASGVLLLIAAISFSSANRVNIGLLPAPIYTSIALGFGLILAGTIGGSPLKSILSKPWLANPGKITYGMYVVHHPIMVLTEQFMRQHTTLSYGPLFYLIRTSISLALTYLAARLLWSLYESKFNAMRKRFARV